MGSNTGHRSYQQPEVCPKSLVVAVVEFVDNDEPPPPELELGWLCERWRGLPDSGAVLDQDVRKLHLMGVAMNIENALQTYRNSVGAAIHNLTIPQRKILAVLRDQGLL